MIPIFCSTSMNAPQPSSTEGATGSGAPVIGCYEMRYGQGDESADQNSLVAPAEFTNYMCAEVSHGSLSPSLYKSVWVYM